MEVKTSKLSQKDYLKKYLSGGDGKKKKKKAKQVSGSTSVRSKVIDDDADVSQMRSLDASELEIFDTAEDAPQVAGIIDERPAELRAKDQYTSQKWKVFSDPVYGDIKTIEQTSKNAGSSELESRQDKRSEEELLALEAKRLEERREKEEGKKRKKHKSSEFSDRVNKKSKRDDDSFNKRSVVHDDLDLEQAEFEAKQDEHRKHLEKYQKWGKGVKQIEERKERLADAQHEMEKPLARYADDEDLDKHLRDQEREGDPMLAYLRSKKAKEDPKNVKPVYQGPFPPNRYGIRPGYRWDGVDRSSGYEKKWFETQNAKKALDEEAYKWGSSDL